MFLFFELEKSSLQKHHRKFIKNSDSENELANDAHSPGNKNAKRNVRIDNQKNTADQRQDAVRLTTDKRFD